MSRRQQITQYVQQPDDRGRFFSDLLAAMADRGLGTYEQCAGMVADYAMAHHPNSTDGEYIGPMFGRLLAIEDSRQGMHVPSRSDHVNYRWRNALSIFGQEIAAEQGSC